MFFWVIWLYCPDYHAFAIIDSSSIPAASLLLSPIRHRIAARKQQGTKLFDHPDN